MESCIVAISMQIASVTSGKALILQGQWQNE